MVNINFEEAYQINSSITELNNVCLGAFMRAFILDTSGISSFSPGTVSLVSELKSEVTSIRNTFNDFATNYEKAIKICEDCNSDIEKSLEELELLLIISEMKRNNERFYVFPHDENDKMIKVIMAGKVCYIANSRINCIDYQKYVLANELTQDHGLAGGECLNLCLYYLRDMLRGTFVSKNVIKYGGDKPGKSMWDEKTPECKTKDPNDPAFIAAQKEINEYIYEEVSNGRPVVLQVSQTNETSRHFVVIAGFDESVKGPEDLNADTMLALDCWDGKLDFLSNCGSQEGGRQVYSDGNLFAKGASEYFQETQIYNDEWLEQRTNNNYRTILNKADKLTSDYRVVNN